MGLQIVRLPDPMDRGGTDPLALRHVRTLQCVASGGVVCKVAFTIASTLAG